MNKLKVTPLTNKTLEAFNEMSESYDELLALDPSSPDVFQAAKALWADVDWLVQCMREDREEEKQRIDMIRSLVEEHDEVAG